MKTKIIVLGVGLISLVSLLGLLVSSAGAAQSPPSIASQPAASTSGQIGPLSLSNCWSQGNLCLWRDSNYSGGEWFYNENNFGTNHWLFVGPDANDQASSVYNNRSKVTYLGKDSPPGTNIVCLPVQWATSNLSAFAWPDGSNMNDSVSSFNFLSIAIC